MRSVMTVVGPGLEVPVHRLPRRKVMRQLAPRAAGPVQIQDRVHDPTARTGRRAPARARTSTIGAISSHCASVRSDGYDSGSHAHIVNHIDHMSHMLRARATPTPAGRPRSPPAPAPRRSGSSRCPTLQKSPGSRDRVPVPGSSTRSGWPPGSTTLPAATTKTACRSGISLGRDRRRKIRGVGTIQAPISRG